MKRQYEWVYEYKTVSGTDALNAAWYDGWQFEAVVSRYGPTFLVGKRRKRAVLR